jgi:aryl-alcohol dehydrogenase-like predicted oxidoreductase
MADGTLERRTLGRTGLEVTSVGLGTGGSSRAGIAAGVDHAAGIVARALDAGVNLVDSAETNGTETAVARGIERSSVRREDVVISTKVSYRAGRRLRTPGEIEEAVRARLAALETDYIDVLYLHSVTPGLYEQARDRLLPALERQRSEGTIRWIGISEGFFIDEGHRMLTQAVADDCWDVLMVGFNLLNQTARERVLRAATASDRGVFGMYVVRQALRDLDLVSAHLRERASDGTLPATADVEGVIQTLEDALRDTGSTLPDLAYRFASAEPGISTVLIGIGNPDHLAANLESFGKPPLDGATLETLRGILSGIAALSGELNRPRRPSLPRRIAARLGAMRR